MDPRLADVIAPPPQPHQLPTLSSSYNITLNLSSIFAMLPGSGFFLRLRKGIPSPIFASEIPAPILADNWVGEAAQITMDVVAAKAEKQDPIPPFPGPWEFFTSGYIIGLFIMAILLHRLQNVIIPSRIPPRRARHAYRFDPAFHHQETILHRIYDAILPLNFSRTTTRFILHLPSVYFLIRTLFIWSILVFQTCEVFPSQSSLEPLGKWVSQKDMADVCWSTFCAVCGAFLVEGFVKTLDGLGGGFPVGGFNSSTSPFNLVGYAFLLHIYSSPIAHGYHPPDGSPSRPDKHVIITITIALLQLTMFHILSISKRFSSHRLFPTALTSVLSLAHFHVTLYYHLTTPNSQLFTPKVPTATQPSSPRVETNSKKVPNYNFPLLNYVPNLFETVLISTVFLTVGLNALVQLLVRGRIERVFSGLGVLHHADDDEDTGIFANLPLEDDFIIVLLRLGIASLEATGLRGWGNEVAPIQRPKVKRGTERKVGKEPMPAYGSVRIGRLGIGEVGHGYSAHLPSAVAGRSDGDSGLTRRRRGTTAVGGSGVVMRQKQGFANDVRTVDLGLEGRPSSATRGPWTRWLLTVTEFIFALWGVMKGLVAFLLERAHGRVGFREAVRGKSRERRERNGEGADDEDAEDEHEHSSRRREREMYERFLRGEEISDDEEDALDSEEFEGSGAGSDDDDELYDHEHDQEAEAVSLFTDLLRNGGRSSTDSTSTAGGEMVLAHLMHGSAGPSSGPLTRRQWNALVQPDNRRQYYFTGLQTPTRQIGGISDYSAAQERDKEMGIQHVCVICTTEPREVLCWPCRCLAMCDNCRENLASRSSPSKHRCPCCRQLVEGYSRIFIP